MAIYTYTLLCIFFYSFVDDTVLYIHLPNKQYLKRQAEGDRKKIHVDAKKNNLFAKYYGFR